MKPQKPLVTKGLLEWLEYQFPDRAPDRTVTDREVWLLVGHAEVLRHLKALSREQEGNHNVF